MEIASRLLLVGEALVLVWLFCSALGLFADGMAVMARSHAAAIAAERVVRLLYLLLFAASAISLLGIIIGVLFDLFDDDDLGRAAPVRVMSWIPVAGVLATTAMYARSEQIHYTNLGAALQDIAYTVFMFIWVPFVHTWIERLRTRMANAGA